MNTHLGYVHLRIEPDGNAWVDGTRYSVAHLAGEHYHHGWSAEELLRQHPDLRPEQVYAALTYFYDHRDRILRELGETAERVRPLVEAQPLSRAELLRRRDAGTP
ncbi:DUF433 domain-containing protein [Tautonia marina]|uniref:DUF433 domain-containing protein n=1 Tax=Tautonia marina TaxID=2653855 RepID=UPI0013758D58|nr:DUF433 domain-containing protein [Tautonia marina]